MTTVLTREYLDARPDGWLDYTAKRIAQLGAEKCYNRSLCEEHLNLIFPAKPPFRPRQFKSCAVVGNSGDLLETEFGKEIDSHEAVIRDNEVPVNELITKLYLGQLTYLVYDNAMEKYAKYVGLKRDFRLVVRGAARNMVKILDGSTDEVLIIKSVTHRDFNAMIKHSKSSLSLPGYCTTQRCQRNRNEIHRTWHFLCVKLFTYMGLLWILAILNGPGTSRPQGHNPLQGRAYYQLLECLGVIRIHSPLRAERMQDWSDVPSREMIDRAQAAALRLKRSQDGQTDGLVAVRCGAMLIPMAMGASLDLQT